MDRVIAAIFLGIISFTDLRKREIPAVLLAVFGMIALGTQVIWQVTGTEMEQWGVFRFHNDWILGGIFGIVLVLIGKVTEEAIGYGDGITIGILGVLLGFFPGLEIFFYGLCLSAIYGAGVLILRKAGSKDRIPFLPFLTGAYFLWLFITIGGLQR